MRRAAFLILCVSCARTPAAPSIVSTSADAGVAPDAATNLLAEILARHPDRESEDEKLAEEPWNGKPIRASGRVAERRSWGTRSTIELTAPGTKSDNVLVCELDPIESPPIVVGTDAVLEGKLDVHLYDEEKLTVVAHVSDSPAAVVGGPLLVDCQPTDD